MGLASTHMHGLAVKLAVPTRKCSWLDSAAAVGNLGEGNPASEELEFMLSLISLMEMDADGVTDAARRQELLASMHVGRQGWDVCDVAEHLAGMACRARVWQPGMARGWRVVLCFEGLLGQQGPRGVTACRGPRARVAGPPDQVDGLRRGAHAG